MTENQAMSECDRVPEWIPSDEKDRLEALGYRSPGISLRPAEREILLDTIEADPNRMSFEKENSLLWNSATNIVQVDVSTPSHMRRFVLHDHFRLRSITAVTDDSSEVGRTMDAEELRKVCSTTDSISTIDSVYSVKGIKPLGVLKVGGVPRTSGGHADVVTRSVLDNDPRKDDGGDSP